MKRSIIAVAALLLLLGASTTYASPRRAPRRPRFWGSMLCWLGFGHHHHPPRMARPHPPAHRPPAFAPGRGWQRGRHHGWHRNDPPHGRRPDGGERREGGRGGNRGRGRGPGG